MTKGKEKKMNLEKYISLNLLGQADFHTHTTYCDGNASPEKMIKSAISKGLRVYGFSGHGYTFYDESYCMMPKDMDKYQEEVKALACKYKDKLKVLCGIEQDCLAGKPDRTWDYIIGSVHYIKCGHDYIPIDETPAIILDATRKYFGGNIYNFISKYFETVGNVFEATSADVIGHFDLISKFNRGGEFAGKGSLFDEGDERYVKAWKAAAEKLIQVGIPFEINTSGVSKGLRCDVYPAKPIREYLKEHGAKYIMSSDSHNSDTLCYAFDNKNFRLESEIVDSKLQTPNKKKRNSDIMTQYSI